jgi:hypothetical protein
VGALAINYALEMICVLEITTERHKRTVREALLRIGQEYGIGRNGRLTERDGSCCLIVVGGARVYSGIWGELLGT